jgi:hypothetical protein
LNYTEPLTLLCFHQTSLELATARCSDGEPFFFENHLDILAFRGQPIVNLVKDRSFVSSAICLIANVHRNVKHVIVNLGIAADEIMLPQNFSYT